MQILTADQILAIPLNQPERLFPNDKSALRPLFARLVERWHPDRNPDAPKAGDVTAHLTALYREAQTRVDNGAWREPDAQSLVIGGREVVFRYQRLHDLDYQTTTVGSGRIVELLHPSLKDLLTVPSSVWKMMRFPSPRMRETIERCLPRFVAVKETGSDGRAGYLVEKTNDVLLLSDVNAHFSNKIDRRHIWWICSRLMNLSCYLEFIGLAHNNISLDACYISPPHHSVCLFGGWWFARAFGEPMNVLPSRTLAAYPATIRKSKDAIRKGDRILIRRTICELLGDPSGMSFRFDPDFPKPIEQWLNLPFPEKARDDYAAWTAALEASFGARRFTKLELTEADIYQKD